MTQFCSVYIFFEESVFTFQFLNDKIYNYGFFLTFTHEISQLRSSTCQKNTHFPQKIYKLSKTHVTHDLEFSSSPRSFGPETKTKSPSLTKHRTWQPKMPHQKCTLMQQAQDFFFHSFFVRFVEHLYKNHLIQLLFALEHLMGILFGTHSFSTSRCSLIWKI